MDDSSLSIDNHSIRVIDTAQDDDETLTSRVSQMTSSIVGNRRRSNSQGPVGNEFSMEEGPGLSDFYADYEHDVGDAADSESDPVFSVFESEDDTKGDGGDTFQDVWRKNEDDDSFDELFAKWAAGDMSNDEFNRLILTLKDEEDSYKGSFRKPKDVYINNNDEYLIQSETLSANENTTSSFMHHSQKNMTANHQFFHLGLDVSSQVDLRIDDERSMLSAALQPLQKDQDFQSIPVSQETSNTGNLDDVQMPVVSSATRDSIIADEKSRKSNIFPQQIRVPNFISKVFGQDGANTKIDQPGNNDQTMLEESFEFSIDDDVFVDDTKQVKASKMVENMKIMYATLFDEEEDVFIENTRDIPDVNGKDGRRSSIDVNYGHDIKEIYIHAPVERIETDEEARMVSENNRNSCDYPHSFDKSNWQTKVNKKLAAVFVLAFLGACGTLIWWLMDMHFKAAPPSKPDFLEGRI